jgi:hypothetical protein
VNRIFESPVGTPIDDAVRRGLAVARTGDRARVAIRLGFVAIVVDGSENAAVLLKQIERDQREAIAHNPTAHVWHDAVTAGPPEVCPKCVGCD